jgi:hypothetical protein
MSKYVLVTWETNWADEMDIEGFEIVEKSHYDNWVEKAISHTDSFEICIGTNEVVYYENGQELVDDLTEIPITDEEATTIKKLVGRSFGFSDGVLNNQVAGY